jgi:uncharacterized membrane protein
MCHQKERYKASIGWAVLFAIFALVVVVLHHFGVVQIAKYDAYEFIAIILFAVLVGIIFAYRAFLSPRDRKPAGYAAQIGVITMLIIAGFVALYHIVSATGAAYHDCLATHVAHYCLSEVGFNFFSSAVFVLVFYLILALPVACIGGLYGALLYKLVGKKQ